MPTDHNRYLIGDDEHFWSENGVSNIKGGCYAKCIDLSRENEPDIFNAINFGIVMENVVFDEHTREVDYSDKSVTGSIFVIAIEGSSYDVVLSIEKNPLEDSLVPSRNPAPWQHTLAAISVKLVLGTDKLNTYLQRYRLELDPHVVALVGRLHLAVPEAVDFLDQLLRYDHQERPTAKEAMERNESFTICAFPARQMDAIVVSVIILACDAFGVLPRVSKLTLAQTMYHFISRYTALVARTEDGIKEPQATFSACFGAAFIMLHPTKYAVMLAEKMQKHGAIGWLVNTVEGKRIKLAYTRKIIDAIHSGSLLEAEYTKTEIFGLEILTAIEGVPSEILDPANCIKHEDCFRVVLLELISGRKLASPKEYGADCSIVHWARSLIRKGDVVSIIDPTLAIQDVKIKSMENSRSSNTMCRTTRISRAKDARNHIGHTRCNQDRNRPKSLSLVPNVLLDGCPGTRFSALKHISAGVPEPAASSFSKLFCIEIKHNPIIIVNYMSRNGALRQQLYKEIEVTCA
ncbi:phosphoenolpyruvate carboxykinase isoform X2 [Tanacetum coccineum]